MTKYIHIAVFGFLGAIMRHLFYTFNFSFSPLNTLFINVLGSFALAAVVAIPFSVILMGKRRKEWVQRLHSHMSLHMKLGITVGFLGAFTTFSTFCRDIYNLILSANFGVAVLYIVASILFGLGAVYVGNALEKGAL